MNTLFAAQPFGPLSTDSATPTLLTFFSAIAVMVILAVSSLFAMSVYPKHTGEPAAEATDEPTGEPAAEIHGRGLAMLFGKSAMIWTCGLLACCALVFLVTNPICNSIRVQEQQATTIWKAQVKAWASDVYGVTAGIDEVVTPMYSGDGIVYSGMVIAQGKVRNVTLHFIDKVPVLVTTGDSEAELPHRTHR